MIEWQEYIENGIRLLIPKILRKQHLGPLFKGNLKRGVFKTELVVFVDSEVSASMLSDCQKGFSKPPPFTEWEGSTWTYHSWGASKIRVGGLESKFTQFGPNLRGRGHRWSITFPIGRKWVQLDIGNGKGGLEWKEFEDIAEKIIKSVETV